MQINSTVPKQISLVEVVCNTVKDQILSGKLRKGDKLPAQTVYCNQLKVSRTVVREAWNKLSSLGLVETFQGKGTFVRAPSIKSLLDPIGAYLVLDEVSIRQLLEARYYLERIIARLAAQRRTASDISRLSEQIRLMEKCIKQKNTDGVAKYDVGFHSELADTSQNKVLKRISETVAGLLRRFLLHYSKIPGTPNRALVFHNRILEAVAKKDFELAEKEMQRHIMDVATVLKKRMNFEAPFDL